MQICRIFIQARFPPAGRAFAFRSGTVQENERPTPQRDPRSAGQLPVASQDELRRKLRRRGIHVTQATLSRDIHELRLSKGPGGYSLPNGRDGDCGSGGHDRRSAALLSRK